MECILTPAGAMEIEQIDPLLVPFVHASSEAESERALASLIADCVAPTVKKVVGYKSQGWSGNSSYTNARAEAEDVYGEVMVQLMQRLQNLREDSAARPIKDFNAYVAAVAFNAFDRHTSRKYPQRRRLKNGLRYLLTHRPDFALWEAGSGVWLGGLKAWRGDARSTARYDGDVAASVAATVAERRLQQLHQDPRAFEREAGVTGDLRDPQRAVELLHAIFTWTGGAVEIDLLTSVVAGWWGVTDEALEIDDVGGREDKPDVQLADTRPDPAIETERRLYLKRLWDEIIELPPRQRAALLLNMRDEHGNGIIELWTLTGVATLQAVADALSMTAQAFAELWAELPLDDKRIAALLGLARQQVINLRKSARERLMRRMREY